MPALVTTVQEERSYTKGERGKMNGYIRAG